MSAHEALQLAFGESDYNSVICIGKHKQGQDGIITYAYIPSSKIDINKINIKTDSDFYITANTLTRKDRKTENLFSLKNIVIDIDCHNSELDDYDRNELLEDFLFRIKRDLELPQFNIIHFTGRGLQLWYCLEEIAGVWSFLYKDTVEKIIDTLETLKEEYPDFEQLNIDGISKNLVGFFRLFETYNTKTGRKSIVEIQNYVKYDLSELHQSIPRIRKNTQNIALQTNIQHDYIALNHKRIDFIKWLIAYRNAPVGSETRDKLLLLFYNACVQVMSREMAQAYTLKLNKEFKIPLERTENIFTYIDQKGFLNFKNDTFCMFLELNENERHKYMEQKGSHYTRDKMRKLAKEERNRRILQLKKEGKTNIEIAQILHIARNTVSTFLNKNTPKIDKKAKIIEYREKGLKVDEICKILGISKQTYYNILKR